MRRPKTALSWYIAIDSKVNPKGLSKIWFRIHQARVKRDVYTGVKWPKEFFNPQTQLLLPRYPADPDVLPLNLQINEYKTRAHRLQLSGYLDKTDVSIDDVIDEFHKLYIAEDFFAFMLGQANELYNQDTIQRSTWMRHKASLSILQNYTKTLSLSIAKINLDFIEKFDTWAHINLTASIGYRGCFCISSFLIIKPKSI